MCVIQVTHHYHSTGDTQAFIDATGHRKVVWIQHRWYLKIDCCSPPLALHQRDQKGNPVLRCLSLKEMTPAGCCVTAEIHRRESSPKESQIIA